MVGTQPLLVVEDSDEDFEAFGRMMRKSSLGNQFIVVLMEMTLDSLSYWWIHWLKHRAQQLFCSIWNYQEMGELEQIKKDEDLKTIPVVVYDIL